MTQLYEPDTRPAVEEARQELLSAFKAADKEPESETADKWACEAWETYYEAFHSEPEAG